MNYTITIVPQSRQYSITVQPIVREYTLTMIDMATTEEFVDAINAVEDLPEVSYVECTLLSTGWATNLQTINVTGVTSDTDDCRVFISPPEDRTEALKWGDARVGCVAQGNGTLTFEAIFEPTIDLTFTVEIRNYVNT